MYESIKYNVEQKRLDKKEYVLRDSIYVMF